jgi:hypothetical protein
MGLGLGLGLQFYRRIGAAIDAQAQAHFDRVIADGGLVPSGLSGVNAFFTTVKSIYGTADITTAISVGLDAQVLGYKLGAGAGTTAGQAAQKLYSVKSTENLFLQSENFASINWLKIAVSIVSDSINAPNGTLTADTILVGVDASATRHRLQQSQTAISGTAYTASFFLKKGQHDWIQICAVTGFPVDVWANFNLNTGTIGNTGGAGTTATIESLSDGWYRCSVSGVANVSGTSSIEIVATNNTNSGRYPSYQSLVAQDVCYVWGAQLNTGSVALPYTPTTTTAETLADVVQTVATSQPLLLVHSGVNYWWGSGVANNGITTPNSTNNDLIQNFSIETRVSIRNGATNVFCGKALLASAVNFIFRKNLNNTLGLIVSLNGSTLNIYESTIATTTHEYFRVSRNSISGIIKFFVSTDGVSYSQLGSDVAGVTGNLFASTNQFEIGSVFNLSTSTPHLGAMYNLRIFKDDTFTTPTQFFNPNQYNPANSQTQWTSSTGEVYTINTGTAATGYKGVLVDRTIVQSDGIDDNLRASSLSALGGQTVTVYAANRALSNTVGILAELSNNGTDPNIFILQQSDGAARTTLFGTRGTNSNVYSAPTNSNIKLTTTRANNALTPAAAEIDMYYNNTLQSKSTILSTDQTFTFNTAYPLNIFSRNGGAAERTNSNLTSLIVCKTYDTTELTPMYDYIKSINNSAF